MCRKPFSYAICLNELGNDIVDKYVSHEPSGRHFNEIILDALGLSWFDLGKILQRLCANFTGKPHNPMLNSGAIMISAVHSTLVAPDIDIHEKFEYVQKYFRVRLAFPLSILENQFKIKC